MRIALVGMMHLPEPDHDEAPVLAALRRAGHDSRVLHWDSDDPGHDPAAFDVCILRATWDYFLRLEEFRAWLERAASVSILRNPLPAVLWNLHKRYLLELADAGIPIIPTALLARGSTTSLRETVGGHQWDRVVIKPAVSAASWKTRRFDAVQLNEAASFLNQEIAHRDMLIQPFIEEVTSGGELSIVWIDGEVTHIIRKAPRFHGSDESVTPCERLDDRHVAFAQGVLAAAKQDALYARIDIVERTDGTILLSELELIEPSLYFPYSRSALERFTAAVSGLTDAAADRRAQARR